MMRSYVLFAAAAMTGVGHVLASEHASPEDAVASSIRSLGGTIERDTADSRRPIVAVYLTFRRIPAASFPRLNRCKSLKKVYLQCTCFDGDSLQHLADLSGLHTLHLMHCETIKDAHLKHIAALASLHHLSLGGTAVTDQGIQHLTELKSMQQLDLHDTRVSDTGLICLRNMRRLRTISLLGTGCTDAGVEAGPDASNSA